MAFQPALGVAEVVISVQGPDGDIGENILHVYKGSTVAWTSTDLTTLSNGIDTWITTGDGSNKYITGLVTTATVVQITCRDLTTSGGPEVVKSVSHAGLDSSTPFPAGIAKAFTFRSGLAGRSNRGRAFAMFLGQGQASGSDINAMSTAALANTTSMWASLIAAITALNASWKWSVLSRVQNKVVLTDALPVTITAVGTSKTYFDYQRRRAPLHARHH